MLFEVVIEKMNLQSQNRVLALQGIIDIHNARLLNNFAVYRYLRRRQARGVRRKQFWIRNFLVERERYSHYDNLMVDLLENDRYGYKDFTILSPELFYELVERVRPRIEKQLTFFRVPLPAGLKIALTLRYLASGECYKSLEYGFRVAHNTISSIIPEVCGAIFSEYQDELLTFPTTPDQSKEKATQFSRHWNFHHTTVALDGKHVAIRCPPDSGSRYYNYKGFYSFVMLALVDADYNFLWVDVSSNGACSDAQIFNDSEFRDVIEDGSIGLPLPEPLPGDDRDLPYFILGDDAFALRTWLMKPFAARNL